MWRFRTLRTHRDSDQEQLEQVRGLLAQSLDVLRNNPVPGTFAGRKTQEPFPQEEDDRAERWMASKELQPPM